MISLKNNANIRSYYWMYRRIMYRFSPVFVEVLIHLERCFFNIIYLDYIKFLIVLKYVSLWCFVLEFKERLFYVRWSLSFGVGMEFSPDYFV